ncbi:hypothetical protein FRC18_007419 [Serendipita sp. 400]|nr:hypothetical protein FRC18_007419 [Serendipita sp. 400]
MPPIGYLKDKVLTPPRRSQTKSVPRSAVDQAYATMNHETTSSQQIEQTERTATSAPTPAQEPVKSSEPQTSDWTGGYFPPEKDVDQKNKDNAARDKKKNKKKKNKQERDRRDTGGTNRQDNVHCFSDFVDCVLASTRCMLARYHPAVDSIALILGCQASALRHCLL